MSSVNQWLNLARRLERRSRQPLLHTFPELALMAAVTLAIGISVPHATSWHYFHDASVLLFSRTSGEGGGLDLYVAHPEFQFGPVAVLAAAPFALVPSWIGHHAVLVAGTVLGMAALTAIRMLDPVPPSGAVSARALGAVTLAVTWSDVAVRTAHLDDALALSATALACLGIAHDRPRLTTVSLVVAVAAKPWAVVFAPLASVPPGPRRHLRPLLVAAGAATTWAPFLVDDPATLRATGAFKIANAPASALRALGVTDPWTPGWVRPAQFAIGTLLVASLCARGRWRAAVMAGLAVRLLLDPGAHHYYTVGAVAGVSIWEGWARPGRMPLWGAATAVVLEVTPTLPPPAFAGTVRLGLLALLLLLAVIHSGGRRSGGGAEPDGGEVAGPTPPPSLMPRPHAPVRRSTRGGSPRRSR
ncbi:MAG: hypothetical protein U0237_16970 [Thermoleophilia bacterium]